MEKVLIDPALMTLETLDTLPTLEALPTLRSLLMLAPETFDARE